jgi:hypothetical protein
MSRFATGSIAEVALVDVSGRPVRVDIIDGEALKSIVVASCVIALDNTVHTQVSERVQAGVAFGVHVAQIPIAKVEAIVEACEAALLARETVAVVLADTEGVDSFDVQAVLQYQAGGKPYTRGSFSGIYVRDIVFRFMAVQPTGG